MNEKAEWMHELIRCANDAVDRPCDADGRDQVLSYTEWLTYLDAIIDNAVETRAVMDERMHAE